MEGYIQGLTLSVNCNRTTLRADSHHSSILAFSYVDNSILNKGVNTLLFFDAEIYILLIKSTCNLFRKVGVIHRFRLNISTLTFFIEGNIACFQSLAACSQAVSDLHNTCQVLLTGCKITVGQLACQCVQHVSYTVLVVH